MTPDKMLELVSNLRRRDKENVDRMSDYAYSIEARIALVDGRARDALVVVVAILEHLAEKEQSK